jgi:hypothetical protein
MFLILQFHILKNKQYKAQRKFIKDAISRALNELFLFGAPIIVLSKLSNHLIHDNWSVSSFNLSNKRKIYEPLKKLHFSLKYSKKFQMEY